MYKFILNSEHKGELLVSTPPQGTEEMSVSISRSKTYEGSLMSFVCGLKFVKEAKRYIDSIRFEYGIDSVIDITILIYNPKIFKYELYFKGIFNLETFNCRKDYSECDIVSGLLELTLKNRDDVSVIYDSMETVDGGVIKPYFNEYETIYLDELRPNKTCQAVYIKHLFERVLWSITGEQYIFKSDFFDFNNEKGNNYGAYYFITIGAFMSNNPNKKLTISFKKLFESLRDIFGLGMCIEYDITMKKYIRVEPIDMFYNPELICQIDNLTDLTIQANTELLPNKIIVGYTGGNSNKDDVFDTEYNIKTTYITPIKQTKHEASFLSDIKADALSMCVALDNQYENGKEGKYDDTLFILSCKKVNNKFVLKNNTDFYYFESNSPYSINADISPIRMLINNSIKTTVFKKNYINSKLKYSESDSSAMLTTKFEQDVFNVSDFVDINIFQMKDSILSEYKCSFNAPVSRELLNKLISNSNGLIKFYNYIRHRYEYAFVEDISTKIIDKSTNFNLLLANEKFYSKFGMLSVETSVLAMTENNNYIAL